MNAKTDNKAIQKKKRKGNRLLSAE